MASCTFSETQFVFGFFHHFMNANKGGGLRFSFPTLKQEGDVNDYRCGSDLVINNNLFIQFKVSDYLYTAGTYEINNNLLARDFLNYYRFHVKNDLPTTQFDVLRRKAANKQNIALYVAPLFWNDAGFDYFMSEPDPFKAMQMVMHINFEQFSSTNRHISVAQNNDHRICYNDDSISKGFAHLFSDTYQIEAKSGRIPVIPQFEKGGQIGSAIGPSVTLKSSVAELANEFQIDINPNTLLSDFQQRIVTKHNIFWIPVFAQL